ncbi:hypothetical protein FNH22_27985 [Fulvivirga sp. M361]|uniref:hypothetical protein n=1 Tax=Fulvivirga sp. M361 TaxID=2594266 RepID=UPI00117B26BB|nr:hypothetical protein [Fulvivirga sp. M361]TRX49074.1 hypothetical protein FNH22_27985 [Fulvivirga sp. M361]
MKRTILIVCLIFHCYTTFSQQSNNFNFESYREFDLQGGYGPGNIVQLEKGFPRLPIITRKRLKSSSKRPELFELEKRPIPPNTFDRKKAFKSSFVADVGITNSEVAARLNKVKNVKLIVNDGNRLFLASGEIAILDLINSINVSELEVIEQALSNRGKICLITEVLSYNDAELKLDWGYDIGAKSLIEIKESLKFDGELNDLDNKSISIKYQDNDDNSHLVGYKAVDMGRYLKAIRRKILSENPDYFQKKK